MQNHRDRAQQLSPIRTLPRARSCKAQWPRRDARSVNNFFTLRMLDNLYVNPDVKEFIENVLLFGIPPK